MYAVFDANNFYVSCERVFHPELRNVPVVVANPGGIVLARSNEAKALGIQMAAPLFKIQEQLQLGQVKVKSTNFKLYGDLSRRIASILHENFPFVEEYSIDESFVFFPKNSADLLAHCEVIRQKILKWTGVPVSVGIAPTKTLAKVAVKLAKKKENGVELLESKSSWQPHLETFPIRDIWGVGWALAAKLPLYGITTAAQLAAQDPLQFRKKFSITLSNTINELNGVSCFNLQDRPPAQKSTMVTRSFTPEITNKDELEKILHKFASQAAYHIRKNGEVAGQMGIFVRGNRFHKERGYLAKQFIAPLAPATAYTPAFTKFVTDHLEKIYPEGASVKRAGVFLFDLMPKEHRQLGLFEDIAKIENAKKCEEQVSSVIDSINRKWGRHTIANALTIGAREEEEQTEWTIFI